MSTIIRPITPVDTLEVRNIAAETGWLSVHSYYLYWLSATVFGEGSYVAVDAEKRVIGYLITLPLAERDAYLILQIGVLPDSQRHGIGISLLKNHWSWLQQKGARAVQASIRNECEPGLALLAAARDAGCRYERIAWPGSGSCSVGYAAEETLYEAPVS